MKIQFSSKTVKLKHKTWKSNQSLQISYFVSWSFFREEAKFRTFFHHVSGKQVLVTKRRRRKREKSTFKTPRGQRETCFWKFFQIIFLVLNFFVLVRARQGQSSLSCCPSACVCVWGYNNNDDDHHITNQTTNQPGQASWASPSPRAHTFSNIITQRNKTSLARSRSQSASQASRVPSLLKQNTHIATIIIVVSLHTSSKQANKFE